jgi:hypothetical protein
MVVDDQTMNVLGKRADSSTRNELVAGVYADTTASSFTLAEDDGSTIGYQTGSKRTTDLTQQQVGSTATVGIAASFGTYSGAPASRANVVELEWKCVKRQEANYPATADQRGPDPNITFTRPRQTVVERPRAVSEPRNRLHQQDGGWHWYASVTGRIVL